MHSAEEGGKRGLSTFTDLIQFAFRFGFYFYQRVYRKWDCNIFQGSQKLKMGISLNDSDSGKASSADNTTAALALNSQQRCSLLTASLSSLNHKFPFHFSFKFLFDPSGGKTIQQKQGNADTQTHPSLYANTVMCLSPSSSLVKRQGQPSTR